MKLTKANGTGVGYELWSYNWDFDDWLVQVSKGVYVSGAVMVNESTVQSSYDSMGRMLRRDNGTTFVWDLLSETTGSVVTDGLVWSLSRGEDVFQVHADLGEETGLLCVRHRWYDPASQRLGHRVDLPAVTIFCPECRLR